MISDHERERQETYYANNMQFMHLHIYIYMYKPGGVLSKRQPRVKGIEKFPDTIRSYPITTYLNYE